MLKEYLQINARSIVFLGDFNPIIIQPFWLSSKKIIRELEAKDANVEVIHNEIVKYTISQWASLEITPKRFELKTTQEPFFEPLKDLAVSVFSILRETPIRAVGINHIFHYALPDKERYLKLGKVLSPLDQLDSLMNDPRLLCIEFVENQKKDSNTGHYRVRIEPSDKIPSEQFGVSLNINDHFSILNANSNNTEMALSLLKDNWINSANRANKLGEELWKKIM